MMSFISVIIPCYNSAGTIEETLRCLESERFTDFEVIVVDDGSSDDTAAIVSRYAESSSMKIHLLRQKNAGVSAARNLALDRAGGDIILFLDADDLFSENFPEAAARIMEDPSCDVMATVLTKERAQLAVLDPEHTAAEKTTGLSLLERYTYSKRDFAFPTFVYRKKILDDYGIRFTPGAGHGEDVEFVTKYLAHCQSAMELRKPCYYYRQHPGSAIRKMSYRQLEILSCVNRAADHLDAMEHPFAKRFREYMSHRGLFSVVHRFARAKDRELYRRVINENPVKEAMRFILRDEQSDFPSRAAAGIYLVHPWLFYLLVFK